jgi:hypothetical protein
MLFAGETPARIEHDDRHDDEREHQDRALNEIRQADRTEAADHRLGKDDAWRQPHIRLVVPVESRRERLAARNQARGGVDREQQHGNDRRYPARRVAWLGR